MANIYSPKWFETFLDTAEPTMASLEVGFLARWLPDPPYHSILDLCCGKGRHAHLLAQRGYKVMGIDACSSALATAQHLSGDNVDYRLLDMRDLDSIDAMFDGIVNMWQSFGYFDAVTNLSLLQQISRRLRLDGRFIIDLNNRSYFRQEHETLHFERNGQIIVGTRRLVGDRMIVELDYGSKYPRDLFEWQLYTPEELCAAALPFGLIPRVVCAWWDEARAVSSQDARMQIVFERTDNP